MTVASKTVTVGTSAAQLSTTSTESVTPSSSGQSCLVYNGGAATIYLGGTNAVTTATGTPVPATSFGPAILLEPGEKLWAISGTAGNDVRVLESGL